MSREAFEKWMRKDWPEVRMDRYSDDSTYCSDNANYACWSWQARQPEIDALVAALESAEIALTVFCAGGDWTGTMPGDALKEVRDVLDKAKP